MIRLWWERWLILSWWERWFLVYLLFLPLGGRWRWGEGTTLYGKDGSYTSFEFYLSDAIWLVLAVALLWKFSEIFVKQSQRLRFISPKDNRDVSPTPPERASRWFSHEYLYLFKRYWLFVWSVGLVSFSLLSIFGAINPELASYRTLRLAQVVSLGALIAYVRFRSEFWQLAKLALFSMLAIQVLLALGQVVLQQNVTTGFLRLLLGEPIITSWQPEVSFVWLWGEKFIRPYGTLAHPNLLAAYLFLASFVPLFSVFKKDTCRKKQRWLVLLLFFIGLILLFSLSRQVWLGALVVFSLWLGWFIAFTDQEIKLWNHVRHFFFDPRKMFFFVFSVGLLVVWMGPRLLSFGDGEYAGYSQRSELSAVGLEILADHPLGVGAGQFVYYLRLYDPTGMFDGFVQPIHQVFFFISVELGIAAGIFFMLGLLLLLWQLLKKTLAASERSMSSGGVPLPFWALMALTFVLWLLLWDHYFWTTQAGMAIFWLVIGGAFRVVRQSG